MYIWTIVMDVILDDMRILHHYTESAYKYQNTAKEALNDMTKLIGFIPDIYRSKYVWYKDVDSNENHVTLSNVNPLELAKEVENRMKIVFSISVLPFYD